MTCACFSPLSPSKSSSKSSGASSSSASSSLRLSALSSFSAAPAAPAAPAALGGGGVTVGSEMMSMLMHWSMITASNRGEPVMIVSRAPPVQLLLLLLLPRTGTSTFTSARTHVPMPAWQLYWLCWLSIATSRCPSSSIVTPSCSNAATPSSTLPSYRSSNVGRGSCGSWDKGAPAGEGRGGGGGKAAAVLLFVLLLLL